MNDEKLISVNVLRQDWLENGENDYVYDTNAVLESIDAQPTVDAVKVVRCKDCIHYRKRGGVYHDNSCAILYYGDGTHRTVCERDFCSFGKKAVKV